MSSLVPTEKNCVRLRKNKFHSLYEMLVTGTDGNSGGIVAKYLPFQNI